MKGLYPPLSKRLEPAWLTVLSLLFAARSSDLGQATYFTAAAACTCAPAAMATDHAMTKSLFSVLFMALFLTVLLELNDVIRSAHFLLSISGSTQLRSMNACLGE
jgi:hypothetical protein